MSTKNPTKEANVDEGNSNPAFLPDDSGNIAGHIEISSKIVIDQTRNDDKDETSNGHKKINSWSDVASNESADATESVETTKPPAQSSTKKRGKKYSCCRIALIIFGCLSTVLGIAMLTGGWNALFDAILKTQLMLTPESLSYDIWKTTPVPISISFYFYNLTNPQEFENGEKPQLQEIGPYIYREYHEKVNISFNDNKTVTFFQKRWWIWDQEASGDNMVDDEIIILNTPPVSAAYSVSLYENAFIRDMVMSNLNTVMNRIGETLTMKVTVNETLFAGYQDPLLDYMQNMLEGHPILEDLVNLPPGLTSYDRMGWFYMRNESLYFDGLFNMFTGEDSIDKLGKIDWWNKTRDTEYFQPPCNHIFGSAGELWPPNQEKTNISFYSPDLCMTLTLQYKEPVTSQYGIEGFRYWADSSSFGSADEVPENQCYCYTNDTCPLSGLLDAQTCRMGSPAFISFPHFLHGDQKLREDVSGVTKAVEDQHQLYIDMIPELGVPISVQARMQINMQVVPYKSVFGSLSILKKVKPVIMPLIWFEVSAELTEELAEDLKLPLFLLKNPMMTIIWSLMIGLGLMALLYVGFTACWKKRDILKKYKSLQEA